MEKELKFELVEVKLDGEQFQPEFLALNPFHHIPVLVDDGFNIVESLPILDYLEKKYPKPAMLPTDAKDLAIARMVQLVRDFQIKKYPKISCGMGQKARSKRGTCSVCL